MNKTVLFCAIVFVVACLNFGWSLRSKTMARVAEKEASIAQNMDLQAQLREKSRLKRKSAQDISIAFAALVNEINFVSASSGMDVSLDFPAGRDQTRLESMCIPTEFRGVRGMPLAIKVIQNKERMDIASALDLVFVMEHETDFKVSKIEQSGQEVKISGMLFGI